MIARDTHTHTQTRHTEQCRWFLIFHPLACITITLHAAKSILLPIAWMLCIVSAIIPSIFMGLNKVIWFT